MKNKVPSSKSSFHSKLIELEKIYHLIQKGDDNDLENIIGLYEKGMQLAASLETSITQYEMRIEEVQKGYSAEASHKKTATSKAKHEEKVHALDEQNKTEESFELFSAK